MNLKSLLVVIMAVVLTSMVAAAPANCAHYEQVWVQDQPGYWDSVPVTTADGRIRYQARRVPPSGHCESVLVNDPVYVLPPVVYAPSLPAYYYTPPVVVPYYGHRYYGGRRH